MKNSRLILIGAVVLIAIYLGGFYNSLVGASESVDTAWAQVETQYQRRFDLVPNLVETVKGVAEQEKEVFGAIAEARTRYSGAQSQGEQIAAANEFESALGRLLVVMENYPELRSNESFQTLMSQLEGTENRISVERGRYNEVVQGYNLKTKRFPGNLVASVFGFDEKPYFEAVESADEAPQVDF